MGLSRAVHTNHAKKAAEKLRLEKNGEIGKPTFNAVKNEGYRARTGRVDNTNKKKKEKWGNFLAGNVQKRRQQREDERRAKRAKQLAMKLRKKQSERKRPAPASKKTPITASVKNICCRALLQFSICKTKEQRIGALRREESQDMDVIVTEVQRIVRGRSSRQLLLEAEKSLEEYDQKHKEALKELEDERLQKEKELMESHIKTVDSMTEAHKEEVTRRLEVLERLRLARSGSISPERIDSIDN